MKIARGHGGRRSGAGRPRGTETKVVRLPVPLADLAKRLADRGIRAGDVSDFLEVVPRLVQTVPLVGGTAPCGFPSPADDYLDRPLDFNELLVTHPAATFAVRVTGMSMVGVGIFPGDIAVVNRAIAPYHTCIVLALLDGEFTIKRYILRDTVITLRPENPDFKDIVVHDGQEFEVWGVVTNAIRKF